MRLQEIAGAKWIRYTPESLELDFKEYKAKETIKWKSRAKAMGFRFPIFNSLEDFRQALDIAPEVNSFSLHNVQNLTALPDLESIADMVAGYSNSGGAPPRDVARIADGVSIGATMPMPIVLKGTKGLFIMAGNTRQNVCRVLKSPCKILLVNVKSD